ncbi:hypothetical protein B0H14DRAFT_2811121 [Mycena olivaceomarginata]|nr:hypothetical protein B0H14DRAFT_2811121 [Mycena olivaceomarginata]
MRKKFQHLHAMALPRPSKTSRLAGYSVLNYVRQGELPFLSPFRSSHHRLILPIRTENNDENSSESLEYPVMCNDCSHSGARVHFAHSFTFYYLRVHYIDFIDADLRFKLPKRSRRQGKQTSGNHLPIGTHPQSLLSLDSGIGRCSDPPTNKLIPWKVEPSHGRGGSGIQGTAGSLSGRFLYLI